mmetsp:Transcript_20513/g.40642  ORF Transcript_20513/g.40642 Transcript_20513/m.40642 type:complete len:209 (-) Transcript_20513:598-1224(-)
MLQIEFPPRRLFLLVAVLLLLPIRRGTPPLLGRPTRIAGAATIPLASSTSAPRVVGVVVVGRRGVLSGFGVGRGVSGGEGGGPFGGGFAAGGEVPRGGGGGPRSFFGRGGRSGGWLRLRLRLRRQRRRGVRRPRRQARRPPGKFVRRGAGRSDGRESQRSGSGIRIRIRVRIRTGGSEIGSAIILRRRDAIARQEGRRSLRRHSRQSR